MPTKAFGAPAEGLFHLRMKNGTLLLALAFLVVVALLMHRINRLQLQVDALAEAPVPQPEVEVAVHMGRIQSHAHKLWAAGTAGNLPLAEFYRHELKEEMAAVAKAGIVDDGVPVSTYMTNLGLPAIDALRDQLRTDGLTDFAPRFNTLIATCNNCHKATGHPYLVMRVPDSLRFPDQVFAPEP